MRAVMPIRTMIFDFDGTVANTFELVITVLNELADEYGYRRAPSEELPLPLHVCQ